MAETRLAIKDIMRFGEDISAFDGTDITFPTKFPSSLGSKYNPNIDSEDAKKRHLPEKVSNNFADTILAYLGLENSESFVTNRSFIVGKSGSSSFCEMQTKDAPDIREVVRIQNEKGFLNVYACTCRFVSGEKIITKNYSLGEKGFGGSALRMALIPWFLTNEEFKDTMDVLKNHYVDVINEAGGASGYYFESDDEFSDSFDESAYSYFRISHPESKSVGWGIMEQLCKATSNIYRRINDAEYAEGVDAGAGIDLGYLKSMTEGKLKSSETFGVVAKNGYSDFAFFEVAESESKKTTSYVGEEREDAYFLPDRNYTPDVEKLIPTVPEWYKVKDELVEDVQLFFDTTDFPSPIRTEFLIGSAGTGKTEWTRTMCAKLGLAYDHITCSPMMDIFDFMGKIFPNTGEGSVMGFDEVRESMGLPSLEELMFLEGNEAYKIIFGTEPSAEEDLSYNALATELINKVNTQMAKTCNDKDYTFVEGGLVKAIREGRGFEIQEVGVIQRAGVVAGLNAILESGHNAFITLPTGEVIKKHPNCCVWFTSNDDYEGTNIINQSVLSRMAIVRWFNKTPANTLAERVGTRIKFPDMALLQKMADCVENINDFCKDHDITQGVCGQRELENWAMCLMAKKKRIDAMSSPDTIEEGFSDELVREVAQFTVLNKVSQTWEEIEDVATGCIDSIFGVCDMRV